MASFEQPATSTWETEKEVNRSSHDFRPTDRRLCDPADSILSRMQVPAQVGGGICLLVNEIFTNPVED
jgi:hypothetical protein